MGKKGKDDITQLRFYTKNSLSAVKLVFTHPQIFLPDLLLIIITLLLGSLFLAVNDLLTPLLSPTAPLHALRAQLLMLMRDAPSFLRFFLTLIALLFVNVVFGVGLLALRYEYMKELVTQKKASLLAAYQRSRRYFVSLVSIKLVLTILYLALIAIFGYVAAITQSWILYALVPFVVLLIIFHILFFFAIQNLYIENTGVKALVHSLFYFKTFPRQTLLTLLFVSAVDFLITLLLGLFPTFWGRMALRLEMLHITTLVIILFLIVRTLLHILVTLWSETFKFLVYTKNH